jgi:hypothetical protein
LRIFDHCRLHDIKLPPQPTEHLAVVGCLVVPASVTPCPRKREELQYWEQCPKKTPLEPR